MTPAPEGPRPGSSLFGHLLAWTLGALALLWLSFILAGYLIGLEEADELVDGQLASVAALVADDPGWLGTRAPADGPRPPASQASAAQHEYQHPISLVVWDSQGSLLLHQGPAPQPPWTTPDGFATLRLGEPTREWRSFARWSSGQPRRRVMVLIGEAGRDALGWDIASHMATPGLWLLPVLALVLGLALRRGLRPLQALADDVQSLQVQHEAAPGQGLSSRHPAREFAGMVAAINTLLQRYAAALQRERALASELAHELRTPLSALVLQARSLRESAGAGAVDPAALARLEQDALRAGQVLGALLALARAGQAAHTEITQPVDLGALAQRVLAERASAALAGGHDLALVGDTRFSLPGHELLLSLALGNLIDNALAHSKLPTLVEVQVDAAGQRLLVCNGPLPGPAAGPATPAARPAQHIGLGLGHQVVAKVAAIHGAQFAELPPPAGFSHCYALLFRPRAGA